MADCAAVELGLESKDLKFDCRTMESDIAHVEKAAGSDASDTDSFGCRPVERADTLGKNWDTSFADIVPGSSDPCWDWLAFCMHSLDKHSAARSAFLDSCIRADESGVAFPAGSCFLGKTEY